MVLHLPQTPPSGDAGGLSLPQKDNKKEDQRSTLSEPGCPCGACLRTTHAPFFVFVVFSRPARGACARTMHVHVPFFVFVVFSHPVRGACAPSTRRSSFFVNFSHPARGAPAHQARTVLHPCRRFAQNPRRSLFLSFFFSQNLRRSLFSSRTSKRHSLFLSCFPTKQALFFFFTFVITHAPGTRCLRTKHAPFGAQAHRTGCFGSASLQRWSSRSGAIRCG